MNGGFISGLQIVFLFNESIFLSIIVSGTHKSFRKIRLAHKLICDHLRLIWNDQKLCNSNYFTTLQAWLPEFHLVRESIMNLVDLYEWPLAAVDHLEAVHLERANFALVTSYTLIHNSMQRYYLILKVWVDKLWLVFYFGHVIASQQTTLDSSCVDRSNKADIDCELLTILVKKLQRRWIDAWCKSTLTMFRSLFFSTVYQLQ